MLNNIQDVGDDVQSTSSNAEEGLRNIKNKAGNTAKKIVDKTAKKIKEKTSKKGAKKVAKSLLKHPTVWIFLGFLLLILFIVIGLNGCEAYRNATGGNIYSDYPVESTVWDGVYYDNYAKRSYISYISLPKVNEGENATIDEYSGKDIYELSSITSEDYPKENVGYIYGDKYIENIKDIENREEDYALSYNFIKQLDEYLNTPYSEPEQFLKPLATSCGSDLDSYLSEEGHTLKDCSLFNDSNELVLKESKSIKYEETDEDGITKYKKVSGEYIEGVWDYGFRNIFHYQTYYEPSKVENFHIDDVTYWDINEKIVKIKYYPDASFINSQKSLTESDFFVPEKLITYKDWIKAVEKNDGSYTGNINYDKYEPELTTGIPLTKVRYVIDTAITPYGTLNFNINENWEKVTKAEAVQYFIYNSGEILPFYINGNSVNLSAITSEQWANYVQYDTKVFLTINKGSGNNNKIWSSSLKEISDLEINSGSSCTWKNGSVQKYKIRDAVTETSTECHLSSNPSASCSQGESGCVCSTVTREVSPTVYGVRQTKGRWVCDGKEYCDGDDMHNCQDDVYETTYAGSEPVKYNNKDSFSFNSIYVSTLVSEKSGDLMTKKISVDSLNSESYNELSTKYLEYYIENYQNYFDTTDGSLWSCTDKDSYSAETLSTILYSPNSRVVKRQQTSSTPKCNDDEYAFSSAKGTPFKVDFASISTGLNAKMNSIFGLVYEDSKYNLNNLPILWEYYDISQLFSNEENKKCLQHIVDMYYEEFEEFSRAYGVSPYLLSQIATAELNELKLCEEKEYTNIMNITAGTYTTYNYSFYGSSTRNLEKNFKYSTSIATPIKINKGVETFEYSPGQTVTLLNGKTLTPAAASIKAGAMRIAELSKKYNYNIPMAIVAYKIGEVKMDSLLEQVSEFTGEGVDVLKEDIYDITWMNYIRLVTDDENEINFLTNVLTSYDSLIFYVTDENRAIRIWNPDDSFNNEKAYKDNSDEAKEALQYKRLISTAEYNISKNYPKEKQSLVWEWVTLDSKDDTIVKYTTFTESGNLSGEYYPDIADTMVKSEIIFDDIKESLFTYGTGLLNEDLDMEEEDFWQKRILSAITLNETFITYPAKELIGETCASKWTYFINETFINTNDYTEDGNIVIQAKIASTIHSVADGKIQFVRINKDGTVDIEIVLDTDNNEDVVEIHYLGINSNDYSFAEGDIIQAGDEVGVVANNLNNEEYGQFTIYLTKNGHTENILRFYNVSSRKKLADISLFNDMLTINKTSNVSAWLRQNGYGNIVPSGAFISPIAYFAWNASVWKYSSGEIHLGIDLRVSRGENIYAPANGIIVGRSDGSGDGYIGCPDGGTPDYNGSIIPPGYGGNQVYMICEVNNRLYGFIFCHLQAGSPAPLGNISQGQIIGKSGSSGNSSGVHCHMEVFDLGPGTIQMVINGEKTYTSSFNCGWGEKGMKNACEFNGHTTPCRLNPEKDIVWN